MALPQPFSCDVAIVGAGPAGSSAAHVLAGAGLQVAVFDKAKFPRPKTCGGGLLQRALASVPFDLAGVVESQCHRAALHHHSPELAYSTSRDVPIVSMVMRTQFDALLLSGAVQAGAQVFDGVGVTSVSPGAKSVLVRTSAGAVKARFVIGADGVASVVARSAAMPALRDVAPALEGELTLEPARQRLFEGVARFDFGLTPHGYGWVFPKRDHLSVGVLTTRPGSCNLNVEYRRYLQALGLERPLTEERRGYMIPLRPRAGLFNAPRILLVGDAAGLVDPVTAEGISAAILSGQLAARAIVAGGLDPAGVAGEYRRTLKAALLRDLRSARLLARGLYGFPRIRSWAFARHGQRLAEFVTDVVLGRARYRDALFRPRNFLKLLGAR